MSDTTVERVSKVIRDTFQNPNLKITEKTSADDVPGWDSLRHTVLLMNVEREFGLRFKPLEVLDRVVLERLAGLQAALHVEHPVCREPRRREARRLLVGQRGRQR